MGMRNPDRPYRIFYADGKMSEEQFVKSAQARKALKASRRGGMVVKMVAGKWVATGQPIAPPPKESLVLGRVVKT